MIFSWENIRNMMMWFQTAIYFKSNFFELINLIIQAKSKIIPLLILS